VVWMSEGVGATRGTGPLQLINNGGYGKAPWRSVDG
jgi:hypothetical protein